jgi:hypothetical protein
MQFRWCGDFAMSGASSKQSEYRANRLITLKGIVLLLIVAVAIGLIVCAAMALVGLPCPNTYRTWLHESSMWIMKIRARHAQGDAVGAAAACAYVTVWSTVKIRGRTDLSYSS